MREKRFLHCILPLWRWSVKYERWHRTYSEAFVDLLNRFREISQLKVEATPLRGLELHLAAYAASHVPRQLDKVKGCDSLLGVSVPLLTWNFSASCQP